MSVMIKNGRLIFIRHSVGQNIFLKIVFTVFFKEFYHRAGWYNWNPCSDNKWIFVILKLLCKQSKCCTLHYTALCDCFAPDKTRDKLMFQDIFTKFAKNNLLRPNNYSMVLQFESIKCHEVSLLLGNYWCMVLLGHTDVGVVVSFTGTGANALTLYLHFCDFSFSPTFLTLFRTSLVVEECRIQKICQLLQQSWA